MTRRNDIPNWDLVSRAMREKSAPVATTSLTRLPDVWTAVREVLHTKGFDAINFVFDRLSEMKPPLYTDEGHVDGLPRAHLCGWEAGYFDDGDSLNWRWLVQAGEDNFASLWANDCLAKTAEYLTCSGRAERLYLSKPDAEAIVQAARAIFDAVPLSLAQSNTTGASTTALDLSSFPPTLRAAVEAFNAVFGNPSAIAGRSPKRALSVWLEKNRPELSSNARELIATLANWQPKGGAPKTPRSRDD